jgi:DNA-binding transcriptional regulator YiaG
MPSSKKRSSPRNSASEGGTVRRASGDRMAGEDFARLRSSLGRSQRELAELLGLSLKAVESYEQGWRKVPAHVERLMYFLLFKLNEDEIDSAEPCWEAKSCPEALRSKCVAYAAKEGRFCWFFTGKLCASSMAGAGAKPAKQGCYSCEVFTAMLSGVEKGA